MTRGQQPIQTYVSEALISYRVFAVKTLRYVGVLLKTLQVIWVNNLFICKANLLYERITLHVRGLMSFRHDAKKTYLVLYKSHSKTGQLLYKTSCQSYIRLNENADKSYIRVVMSFRHRPMLNWNDF